VRGIATATGLQQERSQHPRSAEGVPDALTAQQVGGAHGIAQGHDAATAMHVAPPHRAADPTAMAI
jgi:hypothetical protein